MALPRFQLRNSLNSFKNLVNVSNFGSSSKSYSGSTATTASATTVGATAEEGRPISEMPSLGVFTIMMSFVKSKILNKPFPFDSKDAQNFWGNLYKTYGPTFRIKLVGEPNMVAITDPDEIEKVYRITMDDPVREGFFSLKKIRQESVDNFFDKKGGILIENHDEWHRVRSKIQTPMMRPKNIIKYLDQMDNVSRDFTDRIAQLKQKHGEMPANFQEEIYKWALESVGTVALNHRLGCLDPNLPSDSTQMKLIGAVNNLFELLQATELEFPWWRFIPSPSYNKLKEQHDIVLSIVYSHILEAEKVLEKKVKPQNIPNEELTLLETFLQTEGLTRKDVVTFMLDMFFAGIDTTSHGLGFTLYLLARNKDKQKKLQEELDSVLGDGKKALTEKQLADLSYLKACVKESLRIFPLVIGSLRLLQEDAVISGYKVPKGHAIVSATIITSRDEKYFKEPLKFIPERWMRDKSLGPIHPFASLPFSHGKRMCIGRRIAEQEMYTFLARVLHRYNLDYKYKDMRVVTRLVSKPSEPLQFEFTERKVSK